MNGANEPTRILFVGETGPTQQQINTALTSQPEFQLVDILTSTERLAREVYSAEPDMILVDHKVGSQSSMDVVAELALQFPELAIIAILPSDDVMGIQQVMLAGARAFLIQPFTQINLLSTLRRVRDLESRRVQARQPAQVGGADTAQQPMRTLAVFSPRGGVGCSTVAANLALALQEESSLQVLLMEGKLFFGHLDVMLNIRTQNSIADLLPHASNLDDGLVREVVSKHVSGIDVLLAPTDIQVAQGVRPDDIYNVFMALRRGYDFIVIDAGSALTENSVTLMDASDKILLVTNPDLAALHDTTRFIQFSRSLAYPTEKMLILLNRSGMEGGVRTRDIESALRQQVFAQIPDDRSSALRSLNRGIPLLIQYPRSPTGKAFRQLATSLMDLNAPELASAPAAASAGRSQRGAAFSSS